MVNQNVASMVVFSLSLWAVSNSFLYDRGRPTSSYRTGNLCINHKSSIYAPARSTVARNRDRRELRSLPLALQVLPNNQWGLYAIIATSAATALRLERTTSFGKSLSGPVTAMLITAVLTNVGILPAEGSIHLINLQMFVLKLATPMLLFGADLKKIFRETGVML